VAMACPPRSEAPSPASAAAEAPLNTVIAEGSADAGRWAGPRGWQALANPVASSRLHRPFRWQQQMYGMTIHSISPARRGGKVILAKKIVITLPPRRQLDNDQMP
jgi:hypothetical protein